MGIRIANMATLNRMLARGSAKVSAMTPLRPRAREQKRLRERKIKLWDLPSEAARERPFVRLHELPMPPPWSQCYANRKDGKGRFKTEIYEAWLALVVPMIMLAKTGRVSGKVTVELIMRRRPRADVDNRLKPLGDLLQHTGIIRNDNLIEAWKPAWADFGEGVQMLVRPFVPADRSDINTWPRGADA